MFEEKFENVNVLETLNRILLKNTIHNREDFEYDKEFIIDMSKSENTNDKMLLWMCRPHGTFLPYRTRNISGWHICKLYMETFWRRKFKRNFGLCNRN